MLFVCCQLHCELPIVLCLFAANCIMSCHSYVLVGKRTLKVTTLLGPAKQQGERGRNILPLRDGKGARGKQLLILNDVRFLGLVFSKLAAACCRRRRCRGCCWCAASLLRTPMARSLAGWSSAARSARACVRRASRCCSATRRRSTCWGLAWGIGTFFSTTCSRTHAVAVGAGRCGRPHGCIG